MSKYKKGNSWKRANWDKWGFLRKIWHCISVFLSLVVSLIMLSIFAYGAMLAFGLQGFMWTARDHILLKIIKDLFGSF